MANKERKIKKSTSTSAIVAKCQDCGCTDRDQCSENGGTCFWVNPEQDLCSCCARKRKST